MFFQQGCGHLNSCHVSVLLIRQIPAKNQEVTRLQEKKSLKTLGFQGFGGDYWTRTSDLLRVKMRRDVKALLLGAFRHF